MTLFVCLFAVVPLYSVLAGRSPHIWWVPVLVCPLCLYTAFGTWTRTRDALTQISIHEHGLVQRQPWSEVAARYTDLVAFTCCSVRQYVNFVPVGGYWRVDLLTARGERIHLLCNQRADDSGVDELRGRAAEAIAQQWIRDVRSGATVEVAPDLLLTAAGVIRLSRNGARRQISFSELAGSYIEAGNFTILGKGGRRELEGSMAGKNAWPFMTVLCALAPHLSPAGRAAAELRTSAGFSNTVRAQVAIARARAWFSRTRFWQLLAGDDDDATR